MWWEIGYSLIGMAAMAALLMLHRRFVWWPVHPAGYCTANSWAMYNMWFPFFVASIVKSAVLKFGGIDVYRRSRWFIYGLILGQIVVAGFWLLIDIATGTTGNRIRVY